MAAAVASSSGGGALSGAGAAPEGFTRNEKGQDVRSQNVQAAVAVAEAIRTSLGPRGMDKMIKDAKGGVVITNDGATILKEMSVVHPTARMLVELSKAQDVEAGDGTTSVVIIAGALLNAASRLLSRQVHPQAISDAFLKAGKKATELLEGMSHPVDLGNEQALVEACTTSLSSKVVSSDANILAPMAVKAVLKVIDPTTATNVDLRDIHIVKKLGDTVDQTELVDGVVLGSQRVTRVAGGPTRVENAKIGLIQFHLSPPKTDMDNNVVIQDYKAMDRLLREERLMTANTVKKIAETGCNVLLIQKSILREATTELSLDYLAKKKILVVRDIEREDIEFISSSLGCEPVASLDHFKPEKLGSAQLVEEVSMGQGGRIVRLTGVPGRRAVTVLCRASNSLMLDETERSFHDALCVVRSLVKSRALVAGGGAAEMELAVRLNRWAQRELAGVEALCVRAYADAFDLVPYTLAENAGLPPLELVNELRNKHLDETNPKRYNYGVNVKKAGVSDMVEEGVVQPLLVSKSAVNLATETVAAILKIDDIVLTR